MKVLAAIQASIQLQNGALWLAAGMKITAFDVLSITAVALVEFSKAGCDISLFCDGMASMPPDAGPAQSIIYVEVISCSNYFQTILIYPGCDGNRVERVTRVLPVRSRSCSDLVHSRAPMPPLWWLRTLLLVSPFRLCWRLCLHNWWLSQVVHATSPLPSTSSYWVCLQNGRQSVCLRRSILCSK
jgi:hypothetical protein